MSAAHDPRPLTDAQWTQLAADMLVAADTLERLNDAIYGPSIPNDVTIPWSPRSLRVTDVPRSLRVTSTASFEWATRSAANSCMDGFRRKKPHVKAEGEN